MEIRDIRVGIVELTAKEVDGSYIISDDVIVAKRDDAIVFLADLSSKIPASVKQILIKYLTQHLILMNLKETTSLSLPNNSESWKAKESDLALDQTVPGQNFRALIRKYTNEYETPDDLAKQKHHGLKFFS